MTLTLRASLAFLIATSSLGTACSASGGSGFVAQPCGGDAGACPLTQVCSAGYCVAPDGGGADAGPSIVVDGSPSSDGGTSSDASSCFSDVPCASDTQCVSVGGTTCNLIVHRCQRVFCLPDGERCSNGGQCKGEVCKPVATASNDGICTSQEAQIALCATACEAKMRAGAQCDGHSLGNISAACKEICAPYLKNTSCSQRVMNYGLCRDDGRCSIVDGCGHDFLSTSSCD